MDLVAGVRKEGSRGGRGEFKWEDVRDSQHRENYLGHSLMAPVGRWQKGKDLNWYAKGDTSSAALSAAEARKEEIRKIKEAEESALSEALGYGPTIKTNANETPIGKKEVEKAIKEAAEGDDDEGAKGVGFGGFSTSVPIKEETEVLGGLGMDVNDRVVSRNEIRGEEYKKRRSRSRDRSKERRHRRHTHGEDRHHRRRRSRERPRHRSRDTSRTRHSSPRKQSRYSESWRDNDRSYRKRDRSYSPDPEKRRRYSRDRDYDYRR